MIIELDKFNSLSKKSNYKVKCSCDKCGEIINISKCDITRRGGVYTLCQKCTAKNTGIANVGKKRTDEFKLNRSIKWKEQIKNGIRKAPPAMKNSGSFKKGMIPITKGKSHLDYSFIKYGENASNWRGGITKLNILIRSSNMMKSFNKFILARDNYRCVVCGCNRNNLEVHHIISVATIIKAHNIKNVDDARFCNALWDTSNGITVCMECHMKIDSYRAKRKISEVN